MKPPIGRELGSEPEPARRPVEIGRFPGFEPGDRMADAIRAQWPGQTAVAGQSQAQIVTILVPPERPQPITSPG